MPDLPAVGNLSIYFELLLTVVRVGIVFGLLIFVHELGHFIVAKRMGVKVEKFSLGFGKKLIGWKWGETEYLISLFPLGGYCKMAGELPGEVSAEPEREFTTKKVWQRAAIISAGPVMNYILAFPMAVLLYWIGIQAATSRIGALEPGGPGFEAGLKNGDRILQIDDHPVRTYNDLQVYLLLYEPGEPHEFLIERRTNGDVETLTKTMKARYDPDVGGYLIGVRNYGSTVIGHVALRSPAKKAGFKKGDRIVAVKGQPVGAWSEVLSAVEDKQGQPVEMVIERGTPPRRYRAMLQPKTRTVELIGIELRQQATIAYVQGDSPAKKAGILPGDRVEAVNGQPVTSWSKLLGAIRSAAGKPINLSIRRGEQELDVTVEPQARLDWEGAIGIAPPEKIPPVVRLIRPESKALDAGLKLGDVIVEANGQPIRSASELRSALTLKRGEADLVVRRGEGDAAQTLRLAVGLIEQTTVEPDDIGILPQADAIRLRYPLGRAIKVGVSYALRRTEQIALSFYVLVTGKVSSTQISGPGGILTMAYIKSREGLADLLDLFVFINIGLAFLNLMPVPILDGGHLLFLAIEKVKGRRLSDRTLEIAQYVGLFVLLALLVYATRNDVDRFLLPLFR